MRQPFPGRNSRLTTDMHTLTGHMCNILNASAKDCSISRNQQHMCNNPSLLGSIRLYRILDWNNSPIFRETGVPEILLFFEYKKDETTGEIFSGHNSRPPLYQTKALILSTHILFLIQFYATSTQLAASVIPL